MKNPTPHIDSLPLCEIRENSETIVTRMNRSGRPVLITHHGKRTGIAMGIANYQTMVEEIETLRDIQTALIESASGKGIPHADAALKLKKRLRDAR
jgi:hypothetical protein